MRIHIGEDRLGQILTLQQMPKFEDCGLVRNAVIAQLDPGKPAHRLSMIQRLFGHRIAQRIPILQEVVRSEQIDHTAIRS